jgi:RimJ/RimL family protein N-acetyltransferase
MIELEFIKDKQLTVYQSNSIVATPPFQLMFECFMELYKQGWATFGMPFRNSSSVIWIENDLRQVMGGICYDILDDRKEGWINLSFTGPDFRGQGINAIAHKHFESICRAKGMSHIGSIVHKDNVKRIQSAEKVGLSPDFYRMIKDIR